MCLFVFFLTILKLDVETHPPAPSDARHVSKNISKINILLMEIYFYHMLRM